MAGARVGARDAPGDEGVVTRRNSVQGQAAHLLWMEGTTARGRVAAGRSGGGEGAVVARAGSRPAHQSKQPKRSKQGYTHVKASANDYSPSM